MSTGEERNCVPRVHNLWSDHYGTRVYREDAITVLDRPDVLDGPARVIPVHALPIAEPPDPDLVFDADDDDDDASLPPFPREVLFYGWLMRLPAAAKIGLRLAVYGTLFSFLGFYIWVMLWGPFGMKVGLGIMTFLWMWAAERY